MIELLKKVLDGNTLTRKEAQKSMSLMASGKASVAQMAGLICSLRTRGETTDELSGFVTALLDNAIQVPIKRTDLIDTCGTGGDGAETFNISTSVALLLAAADIGVAKHGNRSVSSKCGSADVLEELGIPIDLSPEKVAQSIDTINFGFLFAPHFHPSFKNIAPVRKDLGVRTCFNILGPLVNPARVQRQVIGVFDADFVDIMAFTLRKLGTIEAMVVHSNDGLDEISIETATQVAHLKDGEVKLYTIMPEDAGLPRAKIADLKGGESAQNAQIIIDILEGAKGPKRDVVLLNAAASFLVMGHAKTLKEGAQLGAQLIDSGQARKKLEEIRNFK